VGAKPGSSVTVLKSLRFLRKAAIRLLHMG
jgi:hypothetical protein